MIGRRKKSTSTTTYDAAGTAGWRWMVAGCNSVVIAASSSERRVVIVTRERYGLFVWGRLNLGVFGFGCWLAVCLVCLVGGLGLGWCQMPEK